MRSVTANMNSATPEFIIYVFDILHFQRVGYGVISIVGSSPRGSVWGKKVTQLK